MGGERRVASRWGWNFARVFWVFLLECGMTDPGRQVRQRLTSDLHWGYKGIQTMRLSLKEPKRKGEQPAGAQLTNFFLFPAAAVPSASGPSPDGEVRELRARDQQLFCLAAGRGAAQHTDVFLLPRREWEAALSGALFLGLPSPSYQKENPVR